MPRIIWAPASLRDVDRLQRFLAHKNLRAAKRAAAAIRAGARQLAAQPDSGRPALDMPQGFRERIVTFGSSAYVMLYRHEDDKIVILAVRHSGEAGY